MSLHDPATFARIVRGMIDIQRNEGALFPELIICVNVDVQFAYNRLAA